MSSRGVVTMIYAYEGCYLDFITCRNRRHCYQHPCRTNHMSRYSRNSEFGIRNEMREIWERYTRYFAVQKSAYKFIDIVARIDFSTTGNLLIGRTAQFPSPNINPQFFSTINTWCSRRQPITPMRRKYGWCDTAIEIQSANCAHFPFYSIYYLLFFYPRKKKSREIEIRRVEKGTHSFALREG